MNDSRIILGFIAKYWQKLILLCKKKKKKVLKLRIKIQYKLIFAY
jgi:hypothetical protein